MKRIGSLLALILGFFVLGALASCIVTLGIWPGEVKLTAPLVCSDSQPDSFVVSDSESFSGTTSTTFTMYCMGERGDVTNHGFARPFLIVSAAHGAILFLPFANRMRKATAAKKTVGLGPVGSVGL